MLKSALVLLLSVLSRPRQRFLVTLQVKSFAIRGMLVGASQSIFSVGFAIHVTGAEAIIVLLLVHLHSLLILALRILRNQSAASAINCLRCLGPQPHLIYTVEFVFLCI